MERLRAIQTVPGPWLPATETWLYNQIRHLPDRIEPHVLCHGTVNLEQFTVDHVHSFDNAPPWRQRWDTTLRRLRVRPHLGYLAAHARRLQPAIVHSHFGPTGWQHRRLARRLRAKHVVTFYGLDVRHLPETYPAWRRRYRRMFTSVNAVLCEGAFMARQIVELGCPASKVWVHHLGVDTAAIPFTPRPWAPDTPLAILIAGSFREKKGIPIALEAAARLRRERPVAVTLVGDAGDDPRSVREKAAIERVLDETGLRDCVRTLGFQPHATLLEEARRHHVFLAPSQTAADGDTEGGAPVAIIEMMAAGLLVVSTRHCDIPGVVRDGITGHLASERDVDGLVACLRHVAGAPERWETMRRQARSHVEREFDAARQGERLADLYQSLARAA
ncbi:MAG: glycosyltransferase [Phycisphaerales bacterium]|nr:glycosyltransferase [Phycisphaerae bacterium]NNF42469.1 glycosyltransferase [Phycisphaerales bacterium]NNM26072.1 glycosyltransferase [Phycisphaerales bacterium]